MSSRQIAQALVLAAGIAILALLIMPIVHVPFIVVHGPMSALRAQRAAWLLNFLIRAAAFLFLGMLLPLLNSRANRGEELSSCSASTSPCLSLAMRC